MPASSYASEVKAANQPREAQGSDELSRKKFQKQKQKTSSVPVTVGRSSLNSNSSLGGFCREPQADRTAWLWWLSHHN